MNLLPFKRVLLSGGTGYLGSHLIPMLLAEGCELTLLVRAQSPTQHLKSHQKNILMVKSEGLDLDRLYQKRKIEAVFHAASAGRNGGKQSEIVEANVELGKRLLQAAIKAHCSHFLHTDTAHFGAQDFYVQTKKKFREELIKAGHSISACNFLIQPVYGLGAVGFLNDLIEKMVSPSHGPIPLGECRQIRDYIYIEDCVSALRTLLPRLPKTPGFTEFGVGTGIGYRLRELVEMAYGLVGNSQVKLDFGALAPRASEPANLVANIEMLAALGWQPQVSLQEGMTRLVRFYLNRSCELKAA